MARADPSVADIERSADLVRAALSASIADIRNRLKAANIVAAAKSEIGLKASAVVGEVGEAVKKHGGNAALFGAGTILAFDIGRRAAGVQDNKPSAEVAKGNAGSGIDYMRALTSADKSHPPASSRSRRGMWDQVRGFFEPARSWAAPLGGLAVGYVVSGAVPITSVERELFGKIANDTRVAAEAFRREHAQGAKQMAAQAFGVAKFAAAMLGVMAAVASYFSHSSDDTLRDKGAAQGAAPPFGSLL